MNLTVLAVTCWLIIVFFSTMTILHERKFNATILDQQAHILNASRLSILRESVANIGHEINNSISVIIVLSSLSLIRIERKDYSEISFQENFLKIKKSAQRIVKIISGIRSMSRDSSADPMVPFDLNEVVLEVVETTQDRLSMGSIQMKVIETNKVIAVGKSVQIFQIASNLINNAIDAITPLSQKWIKIEIVESNQLIKVIFTDSGSGIPSDVAQNIMNPFFTTKPVGKGTGLGLAISARIAKGHGGSLKINPSSPNTEFVLELPKSA